MNLGRLRARELREWVILLLLPVLAFRLFVPAGFMPSFGDGLAVSMQMCHGDAKSSTVLRLTGGAHQAPDGPAASTTHPACSRRPRASPRPPPSPCRSPARLRPNRRTCRASRLRPSPLRTGRSRPRYGKLPFVVGIYERQLSRLDASLERDILEYFETGFARALHTTKTTQMRTVPVNPKVFLPPVRGKL